MAGPALKAIEAPQLQAAAMTASIDVVGTDREVEAHRSSPPTPEPQMPQYQTFHVEDRIAVPGPDGQIFSPETIKPRRKLVRDEGTGEYVEVITHE